MFFVLVLTTAPACSLWRGKIDTTASPTPFVAEEIRSEIPFSTKEPEKFQTEIVVTTDGNLEEKFFAARDGEKRLLVFDFQKDKEIRLLELSANQSFLIALNQKVFAELGRENANEKQSGVMDFLTAELLNRKKDARFESLGAENSLAKFRVNLDDAVNSEIIIWVDENIGLPVKQEFYTTAGEQKILTSTVESKNFNLQPEAKFFEISKDYKKVSVKEFREIAQRTRAK